MTQTRNKDAGNRGKEKSQAGCKMEEKGGSCAESGRRETCADSQDLQDLPSSGSVYSLGLITHL